MVKWVNYPVSECTWEPIQHIPVPDLEKFLHPDICEVKLAVYGKCFEDSIQSRLSSTHSRVVVPFPTDVYRYLFGSKTDFLASKEDFTKLSLSHIWYFKLNCHGQGVQLNFPIRISSSVFEKTVYLPDSNKIVKKKVPVEKLIAVCDTCVCSIDSL